MRLHLLLLLPFLTDVPVEAQPTVVACPAQLMESYCWSNNDQTVRNYQSSNGYPLKVNFTSGTLGPFDFIIVTDGLNGTGNELAVIGGNSSTDVSTYELVSQTGTISIQWDTSPSNSCSNPIPDATVTSYTLQCLDCLFPSGSFEIDYSTCSDAPPGFQVVVDVSNTGSTSTVAILLSVGDEDGSSLSSHPGFGVGTNYTFGPYPYTYLGNVSAEVSLQAEPPNACTQLLGSLTVVDCPVTVSSGSPVTEQHCYTSDDISYWSYASDNGDPVTFAFTAGLLEAGVDEISIHDGPDPYSPLMYRGPTDGDLTGLAVTCPSGVGFMSISSDGSADCASGSGCCNTPMDWTVSVTAPGGCQPPLTGPVSLNTSTCPQGQLVVFRMESTGVAGTPASIGYTVDAGPVQTSGPIEVGADVVLGPFAAGSTISVTVFHPTDPGCDLLLSPVTIPACPCVPPQASAFLDLSACPGSTSVVVDVQDLGNAASVIVEWSIVDALTLGVLETGAPITTSSIGLLPIYPTTVPNSPMDFICTISDASDPNCQLVLQPLEYTPCPPFNDDPNNAPALICGDVVLGSTLGATPTLEPLCSGNQDSRDVWYHALGTDVLDPAGDVFTFSLCNAGTDPNFDTEISAYTGTPGNLSCLVYNDDACGSASEISFQSTVGETYWIRVRGWSLAYAGNYEMSFTCASTCPAPPNDDTNGIVALPLPPFGSGTPLTADNTCSEAYPSPFPCESDVVEVYGLFYSCNSGTAEGISVHLDAGTMTNMNLAVYVNNLSTATYCHNDLASPFSFEFPAILNTDYYILVYSETAAGAGTFDLTIEEACAPLVDNGTCLDADPITAYAFGTAVPTSAGNTCSPPQAATASCAGGGTTLSNWYQTTVSGFFSPQHSVYIDPSGLADYGVAIYSGCGAGTEVYCSAGQTGKSLHTWDTPSSSYVTYWIEVYSTDPAQAGEYAISVMEAPVCSNGNCAAPAFLGVQPAGSDQFTLGYNGCAQPMNPVPACSDATTELGAWYYFQYTGSASEVLVRCNWIGMSDPGVLIMDYQGTCTGTVLHCDEPDPSLPYTFLFNIVPFQFYLVGIFSSDGDGGPPGTGLFEITLEEPPPAADLSIRAFLEGPYDAVSGLMNDDLRANGLIPLQEPYTGLGYAFVSGGGESVAPGVLTTTGNNAIVDWVLVELRNDADPTVIVYSLAALLQRDGDVVGVDGVSPVSIPITPGGYRVVVRHRNHLGVMTASAVALGAVPATVDLTDPATFTYGTGATKAVGPAQVLWAGNVVFDTELKYTGAGNDRDPILTVIGGAVPTGTSTGYLQEDVNLDGEGKYTGAGNDRDPILQNVGGVVPTNTRQEQLP